MPVDTACPGCGLTGRSDDDGPTHDYLESTPACWAAFGRLVAADYASPERMAFHQLVVDAYAAQHPGTGERRQVQSVGLHLMTLCLFLDHDVDPSLGTQLHRRMVGRPAFRRLERTGPGELTVVHVPAGGEPQPAREAAYRWARSVWTTYEPHWASVHDWLRESGFDV